MTIRYNDKEIHVSASSQKVNVDVVYARPEDIIKFDFDIKNVKVVFVDGDVDFIFPNGSVVSLASYATLAFSSNAPKIYDNEGKLVSLENLLSNVQVTKPEDAVLILANRDKNQLVKNDEYVNKVIMATVNTGELQGGNPIAGVGDVAIPTSGLASPIIDKTGTVPIFNQKHGLGDYLSNNNTTFRRGTSDSENILPGNTNLVPQPAITYNFLFGDSGIRGANTTINNNKADYYAVKFGTGDTNDSSTQLSPINMNNLGGSFANKVFDAHSIDGKITRVLKLNYSGGIFPQSIAISGIPDDKDPSGAMLFRLWIKSGGTTKMVYTPSDNKYMLTQLDPTGKIELFFEFNDNVMDQNLNVKFSLVYFDPKTSEPRLMETYYDIGIRTVCQQSDLSLNSVVINKGASGLIVDADSSGSGDKIFIGGNVSNAFASKSGNNLIFTGGGNDTIDVSGPESKNLIYGSTGYNIITGSGTENNWLIFSNDKSYNKDFLESPVIKDSYYNTLKAGTSLQVYLGVQKDSVLALWGQIGMGGSIPVVLKEKYTSNFVKTFDSLTVIGDRNGGISIPNIVGSKESDIFNLYFQGVKQKVNIFGGNEKTVIGSRIILNTQEDDTLTVVFGADDKSSITSLKSSQTAYMFDTKSFDRIISNGKENLEVKIVYDGKGGYRSSPVYFTAGTNLKEGNKALADFSGLIFTDSNGHIEFDADSKYNSISYKGVTGKTIDFFYNFTHITGSIGNDIFYGNSNSKAYNFNGFEGENILTYKRSVGGVTFNTFDGLIYKINNPNISNIKDYLKYKDRADSYEKISAIELSNIDNVVIGSVAYNIGKEAGSFDLLLGSGNNILRYDLDKDLSSIIVEADSLSVSKASGGSLENYASGKDIYIKKQERSGYVKYIGTQGDDVFYGGIKYINFFVGNGGNNTLSYEKISSSINLSFDLLRGVVSASGKQDIFENITNIIGGEGNDTFSVGNFDPTNVEHVKKITGIKVDGGGGDNSFKFSSTIIQNLDECKYVLTFDVDSGKVVFVSKDGKNIELNLDITKGISSIVGTVGNDRFIASKENEFSFDGGSYRVSDGLQKNGIYGNNLDYSNFDYSLTINLVNKFVIKNNDKRDYFKNIQSFISGTADDIFILNHNMDDKIRFFDGSSGKNTLTYENNFKVMIFDFVKGKVFFADQDFNKVYDIFKNFNIFKGGKGSDVFVLSYDACLFNDKSDKSNILLDGLDGNNTLDFSNWGVKIGSAEEAFVLSKTGTISNNKQDDTQVKYEWQNISSFIGSKFGDYFVINKEDTNFLLDGNKDTNKDEDNILDYSQLTKSVVLNISTGVVSKNNGLSADTIKNIQNILLTDKNDTVRFLNLDKGFLSTLKIVDGKGGENTIDFKQSSSDISADIDSKGFNLNSSSTNIKFINFNIINASKGNSIFNVTDNSDGSKVFLNGNTGTLKDKFSILDLTKLTGNVIYNNINLLDNPKDPSKLGVLSWGDKKANIITKDINKILLNNNDNIIYGSSNNSTYYVGGEGNNLIDYSNINDSIYVYIDNNVQRIRFEFNGGEDKVSNFKSLKGTKKNDTFVVTDLDKITSGMEFDGFEGNNTFSFVGSKEVIQIDISLPVIKVKDKILTLKNVQNLILSNQDDIIKISETNVLFNQVDGYGGTNTIDITNGGKAVFNKDNKMELVLSNIPNKVLCFNNFHNIQTTTTTGNQFYGVYGSSMSFKVIGSKNSDVNILSYINAASLVEIDFTTNTVKKGDKSDTFAGINYFYSSQHSSTFYLAKESKDNFETLYIDVDNIPSYSNFVNKSGIISLLKLGGDIKFYVAGKTFEGAKIKYEWNNISNINFTNNQTIYASFDESYKYYWRKVDKDIEGTTLVFDTKQGKDGKEYKDGYVIVDIPSHIISTFDASGQNKAKIDFSVVNTIIGTGSNKDIFYAGLDNVNIQGGLEGGKGTLSYKKYTTQDGIVITFASDNSAVVTDLSNKNKKDNAKFISRFEGTSGNDTFIIAANKGQEVIEIDGSSGVYNKVDFSQLTSGDKGIELDTTKGIPKGDYNYIFKNISTFRLTKNNDTVLGSMGNVGFSKDGISSASIIIDGGGGENTLDYSVYVKGSADKQNKINVDLQMGLISKVGYENGKSVTTNDSIAVVENNQSKINFKNIILSGDYTSNTLIVSGGNNNKSDIYINVAIKNPTKGLKQVLSLENVNESLKFTWNGTAVSGTIGGQSVVYDGFNNIRLSNSDSILIIDKPTNMIESGGALHGGGGNNTLEIKNNEANSSLIIDLNTQILHMNVDGSKTYKYSLFNFNTFNLGYSNNSFIATDLGSFVINFIKSGSKNSVNYNTLNGSFTRLVIDGITSEGAQATVNKLSMSDANVVNGIDKVFNSKEIILTNSDDIVDVKNNDNGPEITIDGKKGINTVSFEKSWEGRVDIDSISGGTINLKGYKLFNFSRVVLTKGDDNIKLKHDSNIQIDGGGGNNTVDYSEGTFSKNPILISEYEVLSTGNVRKIAIKVNKEGKFTDELIRFNSVTLAPNSNSIYTAYFVKQIQDNPKGFNINFNAKDITKVENIIDYSKMANAVNGIFTNIRFENNVNFAEVWRDKSARSESLHNRLIGVTKILGTNLGDVFNIDTNIRNLYVNAGNDYKGEINLKYVEEQEGKIFIWDLDKRSIAKGSSATTAKTFLTFNGFKNLGGVFADGKQIDNIFLIYSFDINYNVVTSSKASSNSIITADYTNVRLSSGIIYDIIFDNNLEGSFNITSYASNNKNNTIRLSGVTSILGNMFSCNTFKLKLDKSSDSFRTYLIKGRGNSGGILDSIEINHDDMPDYTYLTFTINAAGNFSFKQKGYATLDIRDVPHIKFMGKAYYDLVFTSDLNNISLSLFADTNTKVRLGFTSITARDYSLTLDNNYVLLRLSSKNINVNINSLNLITLNDESSGQINILSGVEIDRTFVSFNSINLSEYGSDDKFNITINKSSLYDNAYYSKVGKVSFINHVNKDFNFLLGIKNYSIKINILNLNVVKGNISIFNNTSTYDNKNVVTIKEFSNSMMLQLCDSNKVIFGGKDSANKVSIENTKMLDFSSQVADWNIKLFNSFNYFLGGSGNAVGLGLAVNVNAKSIILDLSDFQDRKVSMEGVNALGGVGLYMGLDSVIASWRHTKGYFTLGTQERSLFNDTTVILPVSGIDFKVTTGMMNQYVNHAKEGKIKKGFTIDGSNSLVNSVSVGFDSDVTTYFAGHTFVYNVTRNATNSNGSDFKLVDVIDTSNNVIKGLNFNIINVGNIVGIKGINTIYHLEKLTPIFIQGSTNAKNQVIFGIGNNKVDFYNGLVDMFVSSTSIPDLDKTKSIKIHGNLSGFNSTLENIHTFDLSNATNYKDMKFIFELVPKHPSETYQPLLILPEIKGEVSMKNIKHTIDLSPIGRMYGKDMSLLFNKIGKIKINPTKNDSTTDYFVVQNIYNIVVPTVNTTFIVDDAEHSYILNGGGSNPIENSIVYSSSSQYQVNIANGSTFKKSKDSGISSYDYFNYISKIVFSSDLLGYDPKFFAQTKSNQVMELIDSKILLDFSKVIGNNSPSQAPSIDIDSKDVNLFISFTNIDSNVNKIVINTKSINSLSISGDGKSHYKVFFVDNSIYYDTNNNQKTFDTSGYFVVVDTNNNNLVYFTSVNIINFAQEFEKFLDRNGKISKVDSYEEMLKAIKDNNYKTDELKPEGPKESDSAKDNSSSENTNHAQDRDIEEVEIHQNAYEDINIETLNYNNPTIKNNNREENLDAEWIDTREINNKEDYNQEEYLEDSSYEFLNVLNLEDQEDYNINSDFNPMDVIEISNEIIDNLSKDVFSEITNSSSENEEESSTINNSIFELANIENTTNNCDTILLLDNEVSNNDPSSQVVDSVNKQNSINGNNHR